MGTLALTGTLRIVPGRRDEAIEILGALVEIAASMPGIEIYAMHTSPDDENVIIFYELYRDQAALDERINSEAMKEAAAGLRPLRDGKPQITTLHVAKAKGLPN